MTQRAITQLIADVATAIAAQEFGRRIDAAQAGTTPGGWQQLTLDLAALAPAQCNVCGTCGGTEFIDTVCQRCHRPTFGVKMPACPLCGGHLTRGTCDRCGMEVDL